MPVVFVHGVGLGPLPYLGFIAQMAGQSPTIVLELPFVSQRLSAGRAPPPHATVRAIEGAMLALALTLTLPLPLTLTPTLTPTLTLTLALSLTLTLPLT